MFAMTTFFEAGLEVEVQQGKVIADAAKKTNVPHLVYSSVGSAHRNTRIPHFESKWKVEQYISELGLPATVLRPTFFMDNFATLMRDGIPFASFETDDIAREYRRLRGLKVKFTQEPTASGDAVTAVFDDTCGNLVQIIQTRR